MNKIIFPRPFAIAIDDLGWIRGKNEGEDGYSPYRLGMSRDPTLADYIAVVDIAKKVGVRMQGLFIVGEMDRENVLKNYPTTTYMREKWDNTKNITNLQLEIINYVKFSAAHLEFGLHGIGHEFWPKQGQRRRAEWYNTVDKCPWPEDEILIHIECFKQIMAQYGISKGNGHSFPESFVPCAYSYYWNPDGIYSLGRILGAENVKFANTDFSQIPECNPPQDANGGGFDYSVHVLNRYNYGNQWDAMGKLPTVALCDQPTDYIETHWPNLLGTDKSEQALITKKWVNYYLQVQRSPNRYCSKNTNQHHSQWLYNQYTKINELSDGLVEIDNTQMPVKNLGYIFPGNLVLKIALNKNEHISMAELSENNIVGYMEEGGYGFIYLPPLGQKKYTLSYALGNKIIQNTIWHDTTCNIFKVSQNQEGIKIIFCLYGTQELKLNKPEVPQEVISNNCGVKLLKWHMKNNMLSLHIEAHDIQGELGSLFIKY